MLLFAYPFIDQAKHARAVLLVQVCNLCFSRKGKLGPVLPLSHLGVKVMVLGSSLRYSVFTHIAALDNGVSAQSNDYWHSRIRSFTDYKRND